MLSLTSWVPVHLARFRFFDLSASHSSSHSCDVADAGFVSCGKRRVCFLLIKRSGQTTTLGIEAFKGKSYVAEELIESASFRDDFGLFPQRRVIMELGCIGGLCMLVIPGNRSAFW